MNKKVKIQVIGSFLDGVSSALQSMDIITECNISGCSPLSMTGETDPKYVNMFSNNGDIPMPDLLSLRKNLANMLSRSPDTFCQNYNKQPLGAEVRAANTSDYLVFMNSASEIPLYKKGAVVFSWMRSANINEALKADKEYNYVSFPFSGDFNWKFYFDKFIDTILNEYNRENIILIKTNSAQWHMDGSNIAAFEKRSSDYRNMINKMDEYFIERTQCRVINEHLCHIPSYKPSLLFPYVIMSEKTCQSMAAEIKKAMTPEIGKDYASILPKCGTEFTLFLQRRLSSEIIEKRTDFITLIADKRLTLNDLKKESLCEESGFTSDLIRLGRFLNPACEYTLSDYVIDLSNKKQSMNSDDVFSLTELYTKYFKLDINDIIAVFMLSEQFENKSLFKKTVNNIINNKDSYPVCTANRFKNENVSYLKEYPYISEKYFTDNSGDIFVRLENNCWLVLNPDSDIPIRKFDFIVPEKFDFEKVIANGYICLIEEADALTYSYDYYIEKARKGDGAKPTYLHFESEEDFLQSLNFIDYVSLLENEKFIIGEIDYTYDKYLPSVDLTELFDPDRVVVKISHGLGDQMGYFMVGQLINKYSGKRVIYDDTVCIFFNGLEVNKFAKKPIRLLSEILSDRLLLLSVKNRGSFFKYFYLKINPRYILVTQDYKTRYENYAKGADCFITYDINTLVKNVFSYSLYYYWISIENLKTAIDFNLNDFIEFPHFEKQEHIELSRQMLSCDSVVIHIRRGDYTTMGWEVDYKYYTDTIDKVMKLKQYPNKKFFVFSDDINWCKANPAQIGLDKVGDCEIVYVEGNKFEESFRDIQLMALGKIMIIGRSYFARIAALYSDRWEMFFANSQVRCDRFAKYVRKNKYDVSEILTNEETSNPDKNIVLTSNVASPPHTTVIKTQSSAIPPQSLIAMARQINRITSIGGSVFDYFIDKGIEKINIYGNDELTALLYEQALLKGLQVNKCFSDKVTDYKINLLDKHLKVGDKDTIVSWKMQTEDLNQNDDGIPTVLLENTTKIFSCAYGVDSLINYSSLMQRLFRTVFEYKKTTAPNMKIAVINLPRLINVQNKNEYEQSLLQKSSSINPFKEMGYDDEYIKDVNWLFPEYYKGEIPMLVDHQSKYLNIIGGHRVTVGIPEAAKHTIFTFGPSVIFGYKTDDEHTVSSSLQRELNKYYDGKSPYQVLNCSFAGGQNYIAMRRSFLAHKPQNGDIAVFFHWPDMSLIKDTFGDEFYYFDPQRERHLFDRPHEFGEYMFADIFHLMPAGNDLVGKAVAKDLIESGLLNEQTGDTYLNVLEGETDKITINNLTSSEQLDEYLSSIGKSKALIGAIVMNCNPFTLGHRYLIEYASSKCDRLYVFAVEEDLSFFPFEDRIELIRKGVSDLKNVTVLPSGKFIISRTTFPAYFEKEGSTDDTVIDASSDIEIFAKQIAPSLNITVRFAGEEPLDIVTRQYNSQMKIMLPKYGIDFEVIPRKEINGEVVSASRVRKLLKEKNFDEIEKIVPKTTLEYLKDKFGK